MKRSVALLLILLVPLALFARDFVVDYVDGYLDVKDGSSWSELFIGDEVTDADTVRLDTGSYAEISDGSVTVKLTRAGTYVIADLFNVAGRSRSSGVGSLILGRVSKLAGEDERDETAVGGVRASEAVNQNQPTWAGGESVDELIEEGLGLLNEGSFEDAYWVFEEAYDYALDDYEYNKSIFYLGYASALTGAITEAFDLLEEVGPDPDTDYYTDHVLVLSQLLVESFAFSDAIEYLDGLLTAEEVEEPALQSGYLLLGLSYDGLGDLGKAETYWLEARDLDPSSDAGQIAGQLLSEL